MNKGLILLVSILFSLTSLSSPSSAKKTYRGSDYKLKELPHVQSTPPELGGSMYRAAAANTFVVGWWQFDTVGGAPDAQGWTTIDLTGQVSSYFHVDGPLCPVSNAAEVCPGMNQHMWCGQWPTALIPWCGWATLPGYGNNWDQSLVSTVIPCDTVTWSYWCTWDTEPGYDFTYPQYWDNSAGDWVTIAAANGGAGAYDGTGDCVFESFNVIANGGSTQLRFNFTSDSGWGDEDGLWPTNEGAFKVDEITVNITPTCGFSDFENFEGAACYALVSGIWSSQPDPQFGLYANLHSAAAVVQEDPCATLLSYLWGFFDDPAITNYACGGFPLQGAMPYGPDANGLYMQNEVWSPWVPVIGAGTQWRLQFLTYRDLPLDNLQFYVFHIHTKDISGCPPPWQDSGFVYYGGQKDWLRTTFEVGAFIPANAVEVQVAVGAWDMCQYWCGIHGTGACHSHAPLIDQVKLVRVETFGPQWNVRHIDLFQDNFPENGTIGPTATARPDMAQDILSSSNPGILPGDSIAVRVTDPVGIATDPLLGSPSGPAVYTYIRILRDIYSPSGSPVALAKPPPERKGAESEDERNPLRYPYVGDAVCHGDTFWIYRMDSTFTPAGAVVSDRYCFDLNDNYFLTADTILYFFCAENTNGVKSYYSRRMDGRGESFATLDFEEVCNSPMEFTILPGSGFFRGGDILYVDDSDDRGGPAQVFFDTALEDLQIDDLVDRFDVLGPSSVVGNSLASRVTDVFAQIIEPYQKIIWCSGNLSVGLIGDGGPANGGSGSEKSDDFSLLLTFLDNDPENPGVYASADNLAEEWATLTGAGAVALRSVYMNFTLASGDHTAFGEPVSPLLSSGVPGSYGLFDPPFSPNGPDVLYAYGGCALINDFDVMNAAGLSKVEMAYPGGFPGAGAVLAQATPNSAATTARFVLSGFAYNYIRDDVASPIKDRTEHLRDILTWFENVIPDPVGIDPIAFENRLENNFPNPFNAGTTIKYSIKERSHVTLKIYNVAGQLVKTLVDEEQTPREKGFAVRWDGTNDADRPASSGVYFYKLVTKDFSQTKKMVILK